MFSGTNAATTLTPECINVRKVSRRIPERFFVLVPRRHKNKFSVTENPICFFFGRLEESGAWISLIGTFLTTCDRGSFDISRTKNKTNLWLVSRLDLNVLDVY